MASKVSTTLIAALLLISTLLAYHPPFAASQGDYSEEITVTIIGSSAYWSINMKGGNVTIPGLVEIEQEASGVSGYQLSSMDSSRWAPEFELFSAAGYNLIGFDTLPSSVIFLKVESDGFGSAERFADSLSRFLHLRFSRHSSDGRVFTFYSPLDFSLVNKELWGAVPVEYGGVAQLLDWNAFTSEGVPIFKFSGEKVGGGFIHTVTIAGLKSFVLPTTKEFKLVDILKNIESTNSSSVAASSVITIRTIGSFISSSEGGEAKNSPENRSATITATVEPGQAFPSMSIELIQAFPSVIAIRDVDRAALNQGDIVTVGIRVRNAAPLSSTPVRNITVNEDWWEDMEELEFVDGETNRTLGHLAPGGEFTLAYRLKLTSPEKGEVIVPPSSVVYAYEVEGGMVEEVAEMNRLTLIFNDIRPAISFEASIEPVAPPILGVVPVNLTIKNNGNGHATNLEVEGNSRQSLLSGDVWQLSIDVPSRSLTRLTESKVWSATWDEGGERMETISNSISLHYNLTGVAIPRFDVVRSIVPTVENGENLVNETISIINRGEGILDRVSLRGELPRGFSLLGGNYTLQGNILLAEASNIESGGNKTFGYSAAIPDPDENYIIQPTEVVVEASGVNLSRLAKSEVLPLGVKVYKSFEPSSNFMGGNITVDARVVNRGSIPIFDVTFNVGADNFSEIVEGEEVYSSKVLGEGEELGSRNKVTLVDAGRFEASKASATFTIVGHLLSKSSEAVSIEVYRPISAEITISPRNPIEGQVFEAVLTIRNPSATKVQDVEVNVDLPSKVRVTEGSLQFTAEELSANTSITREASLVVGAPGDLSIKPPTVSFKYEGDTFRGTSTPVYISIEDNISVRYGVPIAIAAIVTLATVYIARRTVYSKKT